MGRDMAIPKADHDGDRDMLSSSPLSSVPEGALSPTSPRLTRRSKIVPSPPAATSVDAAEDAIDGTPKDIIEDVITVQPRRKTLLNRTPRKSKWNAENILIDSKSPLASANLRASPANNTGAYHNSSINLTLRQGILSNPAAWAILSQEDQAEIISLLPDKEHILDPETGEATPNFASLMNDDSFRYDCASYTENIAHGRHDPEWLASAWGAHERRKAGDFDEYLVKKFEETWEVELPDTLKKSVEEPTRETSATNTGESRGRDNETQKNGDVDELQLGVGKAKATKSRSRSATREMQYLKMDVDAGECEDQLA